MTIHVFKDKKQIKKLLALRWENVHAELRLLWPDLVSYKKTRMS